MYKVNISVKAGKGGDGSASFLREKFKPLGGPDGGDGGKGGDVYLKADENVADLTPFRHKTVYKAGAGENGGKQKMHGASGDDLVIHVPVGTKIYRAENESNTLVADLDKHNKKALVAKGGNGGFGNVHFATPIHRAPQRVNLGEPGEEVRLTLDYRIPVDICIIGAPNSGKSTLLINISSAKPKVAEYPFTTIEPVVGRSDFNEPGFTVAEMPGLVEGSSEGKGLGNRFLSDVSRAKALIFLMGGSSDNLKAEYKTLIKELSAYDPELSKKPFIIAVNKGDLEGVEEKFKQARSPFKDAEDVYLISAKSGLGLQQLMDGLVRLLQKEQTALENLPEPEVVFRPKPIKRKK